MRLRDVFGGPFVAAEHARSSFMPAQPARDFNIDDYRRTPEVDAAIFARKERPAPFENEAQLQAAFRRFLERLNIPFREQYPAGSGRADFALLLPKGEPWALVELKNFAAEALTLKEASDFFEQCAKYRLQSGLPVFVGPFFEYRTGLSHHFLGGTRFKTTAALSAIGGRIDVGLLFVHAFSGKERDEQKWHGFQMTLRQQVIAAHHVSDPYVKDLWPATPIATVAHRTPGSRKDRE